MGWTLLQGSLQLLFCEKFTGKKLKIYHWCIEFLSLIAAHWIGFSISPSFSVCFYFLMLFFIIHFFLNCNITISLLTSSLALSVMQFSYGIFDSCSALFFLVVENKFFLLWSQEIGILAECLSLMLGGCFLYALSRHFTLQKTNAISEFSLILAPIFLLFAVGFYLIQIEYGNNASISFFEEPGKNIILLLIQILSLFSIWISLSICKKLDENMQKEKQTALLEQEIQYQKIYVKEAKERFEQTKSLRHDIKNHFLVLSGLLKSGQIEQADIYLKKLTNSAEELSFPMQTGNPVIDILLTSKLELAEKNGITVEVSLSIPPLSSVDDLDWCVLFSNALDNAITACIKTELPTTIHIFGEQQGNFYFLSFQNNCILKDNSSFSFGTGLSNIKMVVEKYHGTITAECRDGIFCLDLLLNADEQSPTSST